MLPSYSVNKCRIYTYICCFSILIPNETTSYDHIIAHNQQVLVLVHFKKGKTLHINILNITCTCTFRIIKLIN